jgi:hypothetical protein
LRPKSSFDQWAPIYEGAIRGAAARIVKAHCVAEKDAAMGLAANRDFVQRELAQKTAADQTPEDLFRSDVRLIFPHDRSGAGQRAYRQFLDAIALAKQAETQKRKLGSMPGGAKLICAG